MKTASMALFILFGLLLGGCGKDDDSGPAPANLTLKQNTSGGTSNNLIYVGVPISASFQVQNVGGTVAPSGTKYYLRDSRSSVTNYYTCPDAIQPGQVITVFPYLTYTASASNVGNITFYFGIDSTNVALESNESDNDFYFEFVIINTSSG